LKLDFLNSSYSDVGIFIGLTTFEINNNLHNFFDHEIRLIFNRYRKELYKNLNPKPDKKDFEIYYNPTPYYIFGKFDIAFISFIDDFEICGRSFRPFSGTRFNNGKNIDLNAEAFDYKIIAGSVPKGQSNSKKLAQKTFLKKKSNNLPFIAISTLKINNTLLLKTGYEKVNNHFRSFFELFSRKKKNNSKKNDVHLEMILIETFGSLEYTIVFFSNSFDIITDSILQIRELSSNDLNLNIGNENLNLFDYTNSTYGFDFELFTVNLKSSKNKFIIPDSFIFPKNELIDLNTSWYIKPGYLDKVTENRNINVSLGIGDLITQTKNKSNTLNVLHSLIIEYRKLIETENYRNIFESRSLPTKNKSKSELLNLLDGYKNSIPTSDFFEKNKKKWIIGSQEIYEIERDLRKLGIAKIIRNKIIKIISNYNNAVSNPLLFIFFLDLTNFLKITFRQSIKQYFKDTKNRKTTKDRLTLTLRKSFMHLENAYNNRFFQSSAVEDITDLNSEYFGAIHQTIAGYDLIYKTYNEIFEGPNSSNIIIVGSIPKISSTKYFIKINYFHVFQPEIFAAICCHETTNYFFDKLSKDIFFKNAKKSEYLANQQKVFNKTINLLIDAGFKVEDYTNFKDKPEKQNKIVKNILSILENKEDYFIHKEYVERYLKPNIRLLKYFAKDIITLKVGYCNEPELFNLWHWNYFLQIPLNYINEDEINEERFNVFLLRMMFVLSDYDDKGINFHNFYAGQIEAPNPILQKLWTRDFKHASWLISNMFKDEKIKAIINNYKSTLSEFGEMLSIYADNNNKAGSSRTYDEVINRIKGSKSIIYKKISKKLENGQAVKYQSRLSYFTQVSRLNYTILKDYELTWLGKESFLHRNEGLAKLDTCKYQEFFFNQDSKKLSDILVDRQGGLFSNSFEGRKAQFIKRTAFLKSLWELSLQKKKQNFLK